MAKEVYSRLNFLYHAIEQLITSDIHRNIPLIHSYCKSFAQIVQRKVLRLEPVIRRRICRRCTVLLVPGVTAVIRHRSRRQKHKVITCTFCGSQRKYYILSTNSFNIESNSQGSG